MLMIVVCALVTVASMSVASLAWLYAWVEKPVSKKPVRVKVRPLEQGDAWLDGRVYGDVRQKPVAQQMQDLSDALMVLLQAPVQAV